MATAACGSTDNAKAILDVKLKRFIHSIPSRDPCLAKLNSSTPYLFTSSSCSTSGFSPTNAVSTATASSSNSSTEVEVNLRAETLFPNRMSSSP